MEATAAVAARAHGQLGPRLAVLAAAALFSTGGTAFKATALSSWQVAGLRSGVAALVLGIWLFGLERRRARLSPLVFAVAALQATTMILFVSANKLTTAASAIFLQATAPLHLLLLSPWLLQERVRRRELLYMGVLGLGMALFFVSLEAPSVTAPNPLKGNLLGAIAGLTWALTLVGLRRLGRGGASAGADLTAVLGGNALAAAVGIGLGLPLSPSATDWAIVLYLGAFQIALAYFFFIRGTRGVPAFEASLLLLLEPILAVGWAWLILGEVPGVWALVGGALILAATVVKTWLDTAKVVEVGDARA